MARKAGYDREKVLEAALLLFWAKGYHATSLKDLEAALDMRPGSIYAAFGSKEALFAETLSVYAAHSSLGYQAVMEAAATPIAGLADYVRAFGRRSGAVPSRACMLVKTLLETPDDDPVLRQQTEAHLRRIETGFADAFRRARDIGQINPDAEPDDLATRLQASIFGLRAYAQRSDAGARVTMLAEGIARDIEALAIPPQA